MVLLEVPGPNLPWEHTEENGCQDGGFAIYKKKQKKHIFPSYPHTRQESNRVHQKELPWTYLPWEPTEENGCQEEGFAKKTLYPFTLRLYPLTRQESNPVHKTELP